MSEDNFLYVRRIGLAVRDGLGPYVLAAYKFTFTNKQYLKVLQETLDREHPFDSRGDSLKSLDLQAWLNAMEFKWTEVFSRKLGHTAREADGDPNVSKARSYVNELRRTRNLYSHEAPKDEFSDEDVYRIADTATRLLKALKGKEAKQARQGAEKTEEIARQFGERLYLPEQATADSNEDEQPPAALVAPQAQADTLSVRIDLSGARLRELDLRNRNLRFAILTGADMVESNLRAEDLTGAKLDRAELRRADLSKATLSDARFNRVDLNGARLPYAVLQLANLVRSKLRNVKMEFADLRHANLTKADLDSAEVRNARLQSANLSFSNLVGADFRGANLEGAVLKGAKLKWDGRDLLRRAPTKAVFDETTVLPDGTNWTPKTDMVKFTGAPAKS